MASLVKQTSGSRTAWIVALAAATVAAVGGVAALSIFQQDMNAQVAANNPPGFIKVPAGFPSQLRTDGVLDYATAIVLANS